MCVCLERRGRHTEHTDHVVFGYLDDQLSHMSLTLILLPGISADPRGVNMIILNKCLLPSLQFDMTVLNLCFFKIETHAVRCIQLFHVRIDPC